MTVGIWTCCSGSCFLKASEDSKAFQVASQASEPASQPGLGWMDRWREGKKISQFYRALSPIRAAAPLQPNHNWNIV